jgi:hypothetical protein
MEQGPLSTTERETNLEVQRRGEEGRKGEGNEEEQKI